MLGGRERTVGGGPHRTVGQLGVFWLSWSCIPAAYTTHQPVCSSFDTLENDVVDHVSGTLGWLSGQKSPCYHGLVREDLSRNMYHRRTYSWLIREGSWSIYSVRFIVRVFATYNVQLCLLMSCQWCTLHDNEIVHSNIPWVIGGSSAQY